MKLFTAIHCPQHCSYCILCFICYVFLFNFFKIFSNSWLYYCKFSLEHVTYLICKMVLVALGIKWLHSLCLCRTYYMPGIVPGIYKSWQLFPKHTYEITPLTIPILKKWNCDTRKFSSLLKVNQHSIKSLMFFPLYILSFHNLFVSIYQALM